MKKLGILLLTVCLATALSFAQTSKKSDQKATTTKSDQKAATTKTDTAKSEKKASGLDKGETASGKIDVNGASQEELEKLNGIGPVTAKKIVDGRPYKTKRHLLTKKVVSQGEYDKIKDNIIAHQDNSMASGKSADKKATTTKKK
jgi:competence protein ComEA